MKLAIFTLYEGDYHIGVAALVNSAVKCGFKGKVFIYYKDHLPPWAWASEQDNPLREMGVELCFEKCVTSRHFGYHKPFIAREILTTHPDLDGLIYADPDAVFLAPMDFFERWINCGVALCLDANFPWVHKNHPWRRDWRDLITRAGLTLRQDSPDEYPNSGFFGLKRSAMQFLHHWIAVTLQFEKEGGDTTKFMMHERCRSIVGDQDIMAASLHAFTDEPSYLGHEGMGFGGHYFILSHAIENPKPWRNGFTLKALKGQKPTVSAKLWLAHSQFPIQAMSRFNYSRRRLDVGLALLISRIWKG